MSRGAIKLLKQGAILVSSADDILESLNIKNQISTPIKSGSKILKLNKDEKKVFEALQKEEMTIDELARATKIPISDISTILSGLELSGVIKNESGKFILV